jgi:hypothetical protein
MQAKNQQSREEPEPVVPKTVHIPSTVRQNKNEPLPGVQEELEDGLSNDDE